MDIFTNKITSIKALRRSTGMGLKEAKEAIENLQNTIEIGVPASAVANILLDYMDNGFIDNTNTAELIQLRKELDEERRREEELREAVESQGAQIKNLDRELVRMDGLYEDALDSKRYALEVIRDLVLSEK